VTNVSCFGATDGINTVTNANGTATVYVCLKMVGVLKVVHLPFSFTNLELRFNIAVKDANGCTGFVEKTVTQPTQLTATAAQNTR
jgi:hypothetical protein